MNGMNKITVEEAEQLLIEIFQKYTNIDFKKKKELRTESFFSSRINVPVRDAVLALFEVENRFNFIIDSEDVIDGRFQCFEEVEKLVKEYIF